MKPSRLRILTSCAVVLSGLSAFLFTGGRVAGCLGPLGVTEIQCAKALGFVPTVGPGLPLSALAVAVGLLLLAPIPAHCRRGAMIVAALAAGIVAASFAMVWERTWTGVDSAGRMLSIDRPLDLGALVAAAVLAAAVGAQAWARTAGPIRARLIPRS